MNLVPFGSYTVTQQSGVQSNTNGRGLKVYAWVQANPGGLGSITVQILGVAQGTAAANGGVPQTFVLLASAAITAVGIVPLTIFPGIAVVANQSASDILPLSWQVTVIANNANPMTYEVDCDIVS